MQASNHSQADKILQQIFNQKKPSLRQLIKDAIAELPPQHQKIAKVRFKDIWYCVLSLCNHNQFVDRDAIAGTIAAINFDDPNFYLDFKAIAAKAPKRYVVDPLPE